MQLSGRHTAGLRAAEGLLEGAKPYVCELQPSGFSSPAPPQVPLCNAEMTFVNSWHSNSLGLSKLFH